MVEDCTLVYYSFPRILLTMIGLWPYQDTKFILRNSFISFNFFLFIVAQCLQNPRIHAKVRFVRADKLGLFCKVQYKLVSTPCSKYSIVQLDNNLLVSILQSTHKS
ncbi:unnamed protein product [Heterotrigona itama]|uniref:Uncharacterized protein n=1 Tax=Heterotrigona itama TaxID=395501 RepID=A0A6V7H5D1_9HYME|nr:unnamed protein product [Heterotrigona itama]